MLWTASLRRLPLSLGRDRLLFTQGKVWQSKAFSTQIPLRDKEEPPKLDFIPEKPSLISPPDPREVIPSPLEDVSLLGDPSFVSQGLAGWSPPGLLQWGMENFHILTELPWWTTILTTTCLLRMSVFPLVVFSQKNASRLNLNMPEMNHIQSRLSEARKRGDTIEVQKWSLELQNFMTHKGVHPVKNFMPIFLQFPIFMSMFFGLRGMAYLPVESMSTGGLAWFSDLTLSDPYYILPAVVSGSFFLQIYFAVDGANYQSMGTLGKTVCKGLPVIMFPLIMNFPSAITLYWTVTNIISVAQVKLIRNNKVRKFFGIPEFIDWSKKKEKFHQKEKSFKESLKETMDNWKVQRDVLDRRAFDEQVFREAGKQRKRRTYKFNPTAPMLSSKEKNKE